MVLHKTTLHGSTCFFDSEKGSDLFCLRTSLFFAAAADLKSEPPRHKICCTPLA